MSLPKYARYTQSGIDWLGEIPAHWNVKRLKFLATVQTGIAKGKDIAGRETITVPYVRVANVQDGFLSLNEVATIDIEPEQLGRYRLQFGDVLMNEGGDFDKLGRGAIWHGEIEDCIHQNHVFAVRPHLVSSDWLNQITSSPYAQFYFMGRSKQSTNLASISSSNIMELPVLLPPEEEQREILEFLNRETTKINALIAEQEKLIILLAEKRQATISHAVTKGLNPGASMKDSGVTWLGEVPAHWEVVPLMHLTHRARPIMYGIVLPGPNVDSGIPIVKGGDVKEHRLKLELLNRTTADIEAPFARARLKPFDIVYSIRGTIGDAEVVPNELADANITQDVARISPGPGIQTSWLLYVMKAKPIFVQLEQRSLGAAVRGINIFELKRARIPVPPASERDSIAKFLDNEIVKIDGLKGEAERTIQLLKERRSALIAAAVTGQIDVREVTCEAAAENLEAIAA